MSLNIPNLIADADSAMIKSSSPPCFAKALAAFQLSASPFKVVYSLPGRMNNATSDSTKITDLDPIRVADPITSVVVLDSSFNPPTLAHMRMARSALVVSSPPRRILLLLAVNNADKSPKPAPFDHRLSMMLAFAKDLQESRMGAKTFHDVTVDMALTTQPYFSSKALNIAESGFYHGAQAISLLPGKDYNPGPEQVYLAGFDTLVRIFNPKYYPSKPDTSHGSTAMQVALDPFFARSRLRITARPDEESGGRSEQQAYLDHLAKVELNRIGGRSLWIDKVEMVEGRKPDDEPVSSTRARAACACTDIVLLKRLVSPAVAEFIVRERLYGLQDNSHKTEK